MKRRTKQARVRAAASRASKPGGKSRYALKKLQQSRGRYSLRSPVRITESPQEDLAA